MRGPIAAGCQGGSGTRTLWHGRLGSQCLGHQTCAWSSPFYTASMALHHLDEAEVRVVTDLGHLHVAMLKSHVRSPFRRLTPRGGDKLMPGRQGTTFDVMIDRISAGSASQSLQSSEASVRLSCDVRGTLSWFRSSVRRTLFDPKGEVCPPPDSYRDRCSPTCPRRLNQS